MVRLCERVTGSGPEMPELKGIATSVPDYSAPGWDAVLREAQKVLTYYGADTSGVWKGLAANDYMLRIARTADRTCGSSELATIVVEAIDPTALLLDPEALDRMMDEALRDL